MASIGIPEEYEAIIVDSLTQETLLHLPWATIDWQRIGREVSAANVTVLGEQGGLGCCGVIGGLRGWSQMLRIERNGETVWDGPILGWGVDPRTRIATIRAWDRSALFWKRLVTVRRQFASAQPWTIFTTLSTDAGIGNIALDPYPLTIVTPTAYPAERITREYYVERLEQLYSAFKELCDVAATAWWCCVNSDVFLDEQSVANTYGRAIGGSLRLNETNTIGIPGLDVDCRNQAAVVYAGGSGQGLNGYPLIQANSGNAGIMLSSFLQAASPQTQSGASDDLSLIAGRGAAQYLTPDATIEQWQLAPEFGGDIIGQDQLSGLVPGIQFDVDDAETCAFYVPVSEYRENAGVPGVAYMLQITRAKLAQLDVKVAKTDNAGIEETVLASLRPIISNAIVGNTGLVDEDAIDARNAGTGGWI